MHTFLLAGSVILLAVLPGLLVGLLARLPWHLALGFAVPGTYGMVAIGTYVLGLVTVPWNPWTAAATLVAFMVLALLYGIVIARLGARRAAKAEVLETTPATVPAAAQEPGPTAEPGTGRLDSAEQPELARPNIPSRLPSWPWLAAPVAGVAVGFGTILYVLLDSLNKAVDGVDNVQSGWDAHWHASVMTFINETGIASAVELGRLMNVETHGPMYYPDAWHALNALLIPLTGSSTPLVFNLATIVTVAMVIPLSVGALAWRIVRDRMAPAPASLSAGVAAGISGMIPALPYVEIGVGAVPFAISVGLSGLVAVLVMAVPGAPWRIPLAALGLIGLAAVHPAGALVAGGIVGVWWLFDLLIWPRRGRIRDVASLAAVGVVTAIVLAPQILGVLSETGEIEAFAFTKDVPRADALNYALTQQAWDMGEHGTPWVLVGLALLGAVILLALRSGWWLALWGALVLLAVNSMVPFDQPWADLLNKFSNSFYNDARRLGYPQALLMITVAGCALGLVIWFVHLGLKRLSARRDGWALKTVRVVAVVAPVLAILAVAVWQAPVLGTKMESRLLMDRGDRMVSAADREAFAFLAQQPDARTTTIFNDPATGTGWAYSLEGLHMAFNHYFWPAHVGTRQWDVWVNLNELGNPDAPVQSELAESALRDLDVKYVIMSAPVFWHFQEVPPGLRRLDQTPGLTEIYNNGETQIYRVDTWRPAAPGEVRVGWGPFDDREGITSDYVRPEQEPGWVPPEGA